MFLLGDELSGVMAPCMNDGDLLLSGPYFKLLWFRFARRLPGKKEHTQAQQIRVYKLTVRIWQIRSVSHLFLCAGIPA